MGRWIVLTVRSPKAWVVAAAGALVLAARPAYADALGDLEKGYSAYAAHKYSEAEARLRSLARLDAQPGELRDPDIAADARMYLGAVLIAEGKKEEASSVFEKLLNDKFDYEPDRLRVPLAAMDAFIDVKTRLRAKLEEIQSEKVRREEAEKARAEAERQRELLRLEILEKMASEERVVQRNSRWIALLPFGVGQFQNGQNDWGWVFLASEALLAVGSATAAVVYFYESVQRNDAQARHDSIAASIDNSNATTASYVTDAITAGLVAVAIIGAVQAESTFVPEHVTLRTRAVPKVSMAPMVGPTSVGLTLRY